MELTKQGFIEGILKEANYSAKKIQRDAILQDIASLEQKRSEYFAAAEKTDKAIAFLSQQIRDVFIKDESADDLIIKRLSQEAKASELRKAANEINTIAIPNVQKKLDSFNHEISDLVRNAAEECRNSFLQVIDEKMRAIDELIMTWQSAVLAVDEETGTKDLFASFKWIILSDDGTRYVLLPKIKG